MKSEERIKLKFLIQLEISPSQSLEMLKQVYSDNTMSWIRVFESQKSFKDSQGEMKDDYSCGWHSTSRTEVNVVRVRQLVRCDSQLTVQLIASQMDMKKNIGRLSPKIWSCLKSNGTGCDEHLAVPSWKEYYSTGILFLFT